MGLAIVIWRWLHSYRHTAAVLAVVLYAMVLAKVVGL
jgi:hypothetical protein